MERITGSSVAVDLFGPGKPGFRDGDPIAGILATRLNARWFNLVQEEIARVIEAAGIELDGEQYDQLLQAIDARISAKVPFASAAETQAGTADDRAVTPAALASRTATTSRTGLVELATNAEVQAGVDAERVVTPAGLATLTAALNRAGMIKLATATATWGGSEGDTAVTPAGLNAPPRSYAANGYQRLPGGLILQWLDVYHGDANGTDFLFPIAFPTNCLNALAVDGANTDQSIHSIGVEIISRTTVRIYSIRTSSGSLGGAGRVFIWALGH